MEKKINIRLSKEQLHVLRCALGCAVRRDEEQLGNLQELVLCDDFFTPAVIEDYRKQIEVVKAEIKDKNALDELLLRASLFLR